MSTAFFFYVILMIGQAGSMDRNALHYNMFVMQVPAPRSLTLRPMPAPLSLIL